MAAVRFGATLTELMCNATWCDFACDLSLGLFWSALSLAASGANNGRCECARSKPSQGSTCKVLCLRLLRVDVFRSW